MHISLVRVLHHYHPWFVLCHRNRYGYCLVALHTYQPRHFHKFKRKLVRAICWLLTPHLKLFAGYIYSSPLQRYIVLIWRLMAGSPVQSDKFYAEQWAKLERACVVPRPYETISFYNNKKPHKEVCMYDNLFHPVEGYDQSMHRCDRGNWRKIDEGIFNEERKKPVSVLTSFDYGYSTEPLEFPGMYQRKINARGDFFTRGRWIPKEDDVPTSC